LFHSRDATLWTKAAELCNALGCSGDASHELEVLQRHLDASSPRCRQIVMMRKVDGLSQKQIASRLNISAEIVESEVAAAIRFLALAEGASNKS